MAAGEKSPVILVDEEDGPEEYGMVEKTAAVGTPEAAVAAMLDAGQLADPEHLRFVCDGPPVWLAPDPDDEHGERWIPADELAKDAMQFWRVDLVDRREEGDEHGG